MRFHLYATPRVKANPAYATIIILARVINCLGAISEVSPAIVENLFSQDLEYLQNFYRQINGLDSANNDLAAEAESVESLVSN